MLCRLFSSRGERGLLSSCVHRHLIVVASLAAEHRLWGVWASVVLTPRFKSTGSIVVAHGISCSVACGIFPDQGSNLCLRHWQADSLPQSHQGSPHLSFLKEGGSRHLGKERENQSMLKGTVVPTLMHTMSFHPHNGPVWGTLLPPFP